MKLSWEDHGAVALLIASGDFSAGARSFVLDFANVTLADSAALESLLWLSEETARAGGALRLVQPQHAVREALRLTRLSDRFECADSVEGAARAMR